MKEERTILDHLETCKDILLSLEDELPRKQSNTVFRALTELGIAIMKEERKL